MSDVRNGSDNQPGVRGFQGVSLVDFPGRVASVLFLGGCNFRCPFCQNADLVLRPDELPSLDLDAIVNRLDERRSLIDGVVVTGGEPLLHVDGLVRLLTEVRRTGLAVKLDTNGYEVAALRRVLDSGLVDYVAMDVKTSPGRYSIAAGRNVDGERIREAVNCVRSSGLQHEFRTTCVPGIVGLEDFLEIANLIGPDSRYFLQQFRASAGTIDPAFGSTLSYPVEHLREFAARVEPLVASVALRGC